MLNDIFGMIVLIMIFAVGKFFFDYKKIQKATGRFNHGIEKLDEMLFEVMEGIDIVKHKFINFIKTKYLFNPCTRCYENNVEFISLSVNARSIKYKCTNCGKMNYAAANSPDFNLAQELHIDLIETIDIIYDELCEYNEIKDISSELKTIKEIKFNIKQEQSLPFEQTHRETIPEQVKSEIWRRDSGKCVTCGSKQNLHFDHIIPVSKGGATVIENLQLLCRSCNLSKGAKI